MVFTQGEEFYIANNDHVFGIFFKNRIIYYLIGNELRQSYKNTHADFIFDVVSVITQVMDTLTWEMYEQFSRMVDYYLKKTAFRRSYLFDFSDGGFGNISNALPVFLLYRVFWY